MADAIGLTASLITLVATAYTSCQTLRNTFQGLRDAPKHILMISKELQDYYCLLGSLQTVLNDRRVQSVDCYSVFDTVIMENLQRTLSSSVSLFRDLNALVIKYKVPTSSAGRSMTKSFRWNFQEKEIETLRQSLQASKLNLNSAINITTMYAN
jgi:hypothetical protein